MTGGESELTGRWQLGAAMSTRRERFSDARLDADKLSRGGFDEVWSVDVSIGLVNAHRMDFGVVADWKGIGAQTD